MQYELRGLYGDEKKTVTFWDVMLCSLVDAYRSFNGTYPSSSWSMKMEVIHSSEMLATTYKTSWHHNTEDQNYKFIQPDQTFRLCTMFALIS
jgi:hypothetical protein